MNLHITEPTTATDTLPLRVFRVVRGLLRSPFSAMHTTASPTTQSPPPRASFPSLKSSSSFPSHPTDPPTRIGKIARLPETIRAEINLRLRDGQPAAKILPWLNSLPEVRQVLAEFFEGQPVNRTNLLMWRKGGFKDDEQRRERTERLKAAAAHALELSQAAGTDLADGALVMACLQFFEKLEAAHGELSFDELGKILRNLVHLRRANLSERRVEISERRAGISERMVQCREAAQQLAEKKFEHQVRQDGSNNNSRDTMTFEEALDAALQPPPDYNSNEEAASFSESEPPAPGDASDAEDGRAQTPVRHGPPSAPSHENPVQPTTEPTPESQTAEESPLSSEFPSDGVLGGPSRTGQSALPSKTNAAPPAASTEPRACYWSNPNNPPPQPAERTPKRAPKPKPQPQSDPQTESNPVKEDQDRCREKYRRFPHLLHPRPWDKYMVFDKT